MPLIISVLKNHFEKIDENRIKHIPHQVAQFQDGNRSISTVSDGKGLGIIEAVDEEMRIYL